KAVCAAGVRVVLSGDTPMARGWVNPALTAIGHGDSVSWLDGGIELWRSEKRPIETATPAPGTGPLTARPAPDLIVDAAWVKAHLDSPNHEDPRRADDGRVPRRSSAERDADSLAGSLRG